MKQERVDELIKAANERINGPPGARGITVLPEEVLELFDGVTVEASQKPIAHAGQAPTSFGGFPWDAVGRIAAAYIAKQPPNLSKDKVIDYVSEIVVQIEGRLQ